MKFNQLIDFQLAKLNRQTLRESSQDSHDNDYVIIDLLNQIITLFKERVDSEKGDGDSEKK